MSNAKIVDLDTPEGTISISVEVLKDDRTKMSEVDQTNYRACVLECHKVLDELQIPTVVKGETRCGDPTCNSALGHRLRELRKLYLYQLALLQSLQENPENIREILSNQNKSH